MKKILSIIVLLASFTGFSQQWQGTIKAGSQANSVKIYIKPAAPIAEAYINTLDVALLIPASVMPAPVATILDKPLTNLAWTGDPVPTASTSEMLSGVAYHCYLFHADGNAVTGGFDGGEVAALEVAFAGSGMTDVRLGQLPNGGSNGQINFYLATNKDADAVNVNPFYGPGAVNDGLSYGGTSYVPLSNVTLPVHFLSFYAIKNGDDARLNWTVENDADNNYFEIERSLDGRSYSKVAKVSAMNNGSYSNTYETTDRAISSLGSSVVFYRIKQVDNNGTVLYSPIRNLNLSISLDAVNLFPNPARTTTKLVWDVQNAGKGTIVIRDATGKQVQMISMELVKGVNQRDINVSALPSGEYTVTLLGTNFKQTIKLSKIN